MLPPDRANAAYRPYGADEPVYQNASLTVAQGTEKVVLKYNVISLEYPEWVRQQSPFDDVWSLAVYGGAGGAQLFQTWRNVNSQLGGAPAWQIDSSIGGMQEELDVSELTANGDIQLVMVASAVNVRDYHFDTTVTAELGGVGALKINTVTKDKLTKTKSQSQFVSIPRPKAKNHHQRWFTLNVSKPKPETEIKKVRLVLLSGAGGTLQNLFEAAPGDNVKLENGGEIVKVRITMHDVESSVPSTPPSTHSIRYRFQVQAEVDGELKWSDPQDSEDLIALWRMPGPGVFARYPVDDRDPGLDDWGIRGTYEWLAQNVSLFAKTSINDISGEHAWDIEHTQHALGGVEIDIFHFKRMPGAWNARSNYILLRDHVLKAVDGNAQSKGLVKGVGRGDAYWVRRFHTAARGREAVHDAGRTA